MTATSKSWKTGSLKEDFISASEKPATIYSDGTYREKNPDWHLKDASAKAEDVLPFLLQILDARAGRLVVADIGAGVGGVSAELSRLLRLQRPNAEVQFECYDLSPSAAAEGRRLFPSLKFRCGEIGDEDGPWDVCLLIDVLEHLENPHAFLMMLGLKCRSFVVRQPLQENLSTWRHNNYRAQREQWGHISFFNDRNFRDMASAAGWDAVDTGLYLSGEYGESRGKRIPFHRKLVTQISRSWAAYIFGAYLIGTFRSRNYISS